MAPAVNNQPYDRYVHKYPPWTHFNVIPVSRNSLINLKKIAGGECHRVQVYIYTHFYCLVVESGFYSDAVECLPVDPVTSI